MKRLDIALVVIAVIIVALPFVTLGPEGGPLLRPADLAQPMGALGKLRLARLPFTDRPIQGPTQAYKWQDSTGQWHYGTQPPPEGVKYEQMEVDPNANVMPALESEDER